MMKYFILAFLIATTICAETKQQIHKQTFKVDTVTVSEGNTHFLSGNFGFTYDVATKKIPTFNFIPNINSKDTVFVMGAPKADDKVKHKVTECTDKNFCTKIAEEVEVRVLGQGKKSFKQALTVAPLVSATSYKPVGVTPTESTGFKTAYLENEGQVSSNQLGLSPESLYLAWLGKTYAFSGAADGDVMFKVCINESKPLSASTVFEKSSSITGHIDFEWIKDADLSNVHESEVPATLDTEVSRWAIKNTVFETQTIKDNKIALAIPLPKVACFTTMYNELMVFNDNSDHENFKKVISQAICKKDECTDVTSLSTAPRLKITFDKTELVPKVRILATETKSQSDLHKVVYFEPSEYLYIKDKKIVFNTKLDKESGAFERYCEDKNIAFGLPFYAKKRVYFSRKGGKSYVKLADPKSSFFSSSNLWTFFKWALIVLVVLAVLLGVAAAVFFFIRSRKSDESGLGSYGSETNHI